MTIEHLTRIAALSVVFTTVCMSTIAMPTDDADSKESKPPTVSTPNKAGSANDKSKRIEFENALIKMIVIPRSREQMKAFYEGRGFPQPAIAAIAGACFMTVIIKNKTNNTLWLELDNWQFRGASAEVKRLDRTYWHQHWESLGIPMASRSTFGWTLLPERRDLRVSEGVGGNITMTHTEQSFQLTAKFFRGADKQISPLSVQLHQLQCIK
jgi:hypothetical protein